MKKTDAELVSDYLEGDEGSLNVLVNRYLKDVYNFAYQLTQNREAAEDIAQESFVKAWKHIRNYRENNNFRTWIFSITRNTAIDWLRTRKELPFSAFDTEDGKNALVDSLSDQQLLPDELIARAEDVHLVEDLLIQLDSKYREVLTLRYSSNLTFEEIGNILKKPLYTVKSQHRRALAALRRLLAEPA